MIQYHHAISSNGEIANIREVTRETRASQQFSCIGCGAKMTAVLGNVKAHHFRHNGDSCSWESYLHRLGKLMLKQRFDASQEFPVKYHVRNGCPNFHACRLRGDPVWQKCPSVKLSAFDLKEYYDTCEVEATYKGFRADLMLTHSGQPERAPVFLEIAVSHRCEERKIASGIRIIEIDVRSERDAVRDIVESNDPFARLESDNNIFTEVPGIRFYNFKRTYEPEYSLDRFYLYKDKNGILRAKLKQNAVSCHDVANKHEEGACFEVTLSTDYRKHPQRNILYALGVALSIKKGYAAKNCAFCSHFNRCRLRFEFLDESSGSYYYKKIANKSIPPSKLDKWRQASSCDKYHVSGSRWQKIIDSCKSLPYLEWSKDE